MGYTVFFYRQGYEVGVLLHSRLGVAHHYGNAAVVEHLDVVAAVAEGYGVGHVDAEMTAEDVHAGGLGVVGADNVGEGVVPSWQTAMGHETLHLGIARGRHDAYNLIVVALCHAAHVHNGRHGNVEAVLEA